MQNEHVNGTDREVRLDEAVAAYLREAEAGRPPDPAAFLAAHPGLEDDLRRFLAAEQRFGRWAAPLRAAALAGPDGPAPARPGRLGDFELVREVGRGGMGAVYEARQTSLNRRVALKVLPFAATLDPRQLQRFKNEAQAAAALHHTNIVPVHYVGCERGVHFYAMQFIDGRSLAELLRELRRPDAGPQAKPPEPAAGDPTTAYAPGPDAHGPAAADTPAAAALSTAHASGSPGYFREVARLGVQAAEALEHAHQLGVVHRDVKPANLLVDGRGNLWVTDFGLAQLSTGESLTLTGDLVGTLRYMSPEQALAKRVAVDHRTDVYSLGATLYELLTLKPAFTGNDRQDLLRQIAFEEPVAPRKVRKGVPAELETIVLKAMEKNPADRYATAQECADDLRRFLDDRPVLARRPTPAQRLRKWCRRHPAAVRSAAVVLALLAAVAGWLAHDRSARLAVAAAASREADERLGEGNVPEALSAAKRAEGLLAGCLAAAAARNQAAVFRTDVELLGRLAEVRLLRTAVKDGALDDAATETGYAEVFQSYGVGPEQLAQPCTAERLRTRPIRQQLAAALLDWAVLREKVRPGDGRSWREMVALAQAIDPDPWRERFRDAVERADLPALKRMAASDEVRALRPVTLALMGSILRWMGAFAEAVELLQAAQKRNPGDFWVNFELASSSEMLTPPPPGTCHPLLHGGGGVEAGKPGCSHQPGGGPPGQRGVGRGHHRVPRGSPPQARLLRGALQPGNRPAGQRGRGWRHRRGPACPPPQARRPRRPLQSRFCAEESGAVRRGPGILPARAPTGLQGPGLALPYRPVSPRLRTPGGAGPQIAGVARRRG